MNACTDPDLDDPRTLIYRLLARALKEEPPGGLPSDFVQRVSALAVQSRPAVAALLPAPSIARWLLALFGCIGLTWLVGAGSRLANRSI